MVKAGKLSIVHYQLSIINYQTSDRFEYKHFQCDKIYLLVAIIVALQMLILQFALYQRIAY